MRIVAVANQKGGVGKSTTTYHLAHAATEAGKRVLVVDADPQGNLTSVIAAEVEADWVGLADVLSSQTDVTVSDALVPGIWPRMTVLPTPNGRVLGMVRDQLVVAGAGRERRLDEALAEVKTDFDLCLIDCPPSLDQLTINALTAADSVAVVSHARLWAADGLAHLLGTIEEVRRYYNPALRVGGLLVNQYEERTVSGRHWWEELSQSAEHQFPVLTPPIPKRVIIADSAESSTTLAEWGSEGRALAGLYADHLSTLMNGAH